MSHINLNSEQKRAVSHSAGPLLIIAGAGTGKTTVITERIKNLISKKGVKPDEILALTFTEKAASEMVERIDEIMPYGYTQMWISTFHSFCDMVLRADAFQIGLNPSYKLMSETEGILLLKKNIFKLNLSYYKPLSNPNKFLEALINHFSRLKDEDVTPEEYKKYANSIKKEVDNGEDFLTVDQIQELSYAYSKYEILKAEASVMDFGDLISNTLRLFRKRKNVLKKYQRKFEFILVDEFQDTNYAQNELAILLSGKKKNITVVADDDQAIYRWRGAAVSNVIQFKSNFPGAKIISLTKNYRSTKTILDSSYRLIQNNNPNRLEVVEKINKKLTSERKLKGKPIEFLYSNRLDEEAEKITNRIEKLIESKKYSYRDIALLVRANNHAHPIASFFQRKKIPYQFLGPGQLFHQEEIRDLVSYLKVLYDLSDSVSLFRVLSMDHFSISQLELNHLLNHSRKNNLTLLEALKDTDKLEISNKTEKELDKIYKMIKRHIELIRRESAGQILYYFLVDTGIYQLLLSYKTRDEERAVENIAKFFDKLKNFEYSEENAGIYAVVDWIDLSMQLGESPLAPEIDKKEYDAVNILTVHSSKGLEFPVVFIANLVTERFPSRDRKEKIPVPAKLIKEILPEGNFHTQEERRLFYVAMTRARDLLIFSAAAFYGEGKRKRQISPFVAESLPGIKETSQLKSAKSSLKDIADEYGERDVSNKKKPQSIKVKNISFSNLQMFDICPLHYKAKAVLKIPTQTSHVQSFGISIHSALRQFYENAKKNKKTNLKKLKGFLKDNWISEGYDNKEHEAQRLKQANKILTNFYKKSFNPEHLPEAIELPFSFFLKNGVKVHGIIDRIDATENGIEIIDYKTGQNNPKARRAHELQLAMYALAASKVSHPLLMKKPDNVMLSLIFLETGEKKSMNFNSQDLKNLESKLGDQIKEIEKSDFKCSKNVLCLSCEFKMLCNVKS